MIRLILINTQEWIRLKFFQIIIFLSIAFVVFSQLLGSLSFTEQIRLVSDFGLAGIEISMLFIACFFSTHALAKDIDRKTILVILARPIPRWKILIGYFGSLALLNFITLFVLGSTLFYFLSNSNQVSLTNYLVSLVCIFLKSLVIGSFGLWTGIIARPMFAFVLSLSYWFMSYSVYEVQFFIKKINIDNHQTISSVLNLIFPQFYKYNWKSFGFLKSTLVISDLNWAIIHSLGWIFLFLYFSSMSFRRKEIV